MGFTEERKTGDGRRKTSEDGPPEDDYRGAPFLPILLYVLGFTLALALLAFAGVWLLRIL